MPRVQHRNLWTWRSVVWLLVPGIILHELTHWYAASTLPGATPREIDWRVPTCTVEYDRAPRRTVLLTQLAPSLAGFAVGWVSLVLLSQGIAHAPTVGLAATVWLLGNWLVYSLPTLDDVRGATWALGPSA